tara:strand:+ start:3587 stop:3859 length:273 start_codon:yes stop_codon:yes gene_type:complete
MSFQNLMKNELIVKKILEYIDTRKLSELYDTFPQFQKIIEKYKISYKRCQGCWWDELGQLAHMESPYGCLSEPESPPPKKRRKAITINIS